MKRILLAVACVALLPVIAQEECCEQPKTYPRIVYHTHVEGQQDIWDCQPYHEECPCVESELLGEYPRSYFQRVDSDAMAYPGRREDALMDSMSE